MSLTEQAARDALGNVIEPEIKRALTDLNMIRDLAVEGERVSVTVVLATPDHPQQARIEEDVRGALQSAGAKDIQIKWDANVRTRVIEEADPIPQVKNVILVMSGKGGVGKSTVAANLTMALQRQGQRVGLLDADIYGPSVPTMLGVAGRPMSRDGKKIEPLQRFGIKLMSMGFLLEDDKSAVIWRGPMLHGALKQFFSDVNWGPLDFLLVDLPPGTGDVALTLAQRVKCTGAIMVTTPQEVALQDVYKSVAMCQKVDVPLLGVVENMSYFKDPAGNQHKLFGEGGGEKIAEFAGAPLLGQLPLETKAREWGDAGTPVTQAAPDLGISKLFMDIATQMQARAALENAKQPSFDIDRSGGKGRVHLPIAK